MSTTEQFSQGRLAPAGPPQDGWSRRRRAWTAAVSILLHVLALLALLLIAKRPEGTEGSQAPSYQLLFESPDANAPPSPAGQPDASPAPEPQPAAPPSAPPPPPAPPTDALPGPESPAPMAPPAAEAPPQPPASPAPPAPAAVPVPESAAPTPPPAVQPAAPAPAPTPPAPTPPAPPADTAVSPEPAPLPAPSSPPQVNLVSPQEQPPPPPPVPAFVPPAPPPPLPAAPPRPPPPQRPRTAPPQQQAGTFANPMDLNFGPSTNRAPAARVIAPRGSVASRSLDLSPGAPKGPNHADAFFDARAARLGADWEGALMAYWLSHRYYPRQAAEDGADGTVDLELTVDATGRVEKADVKSHSGNQFLDMAAVGTWRNAKLPPLPPELGDRYTFTITINYVLIR
jgi:TonB family protein